MANYLKSTCTILLALSFSLATAQTSANPKPPKVKSHPAPKVGKHPAASHPAPAADSTKTHKAYEKTQKKLAKQMKKQQKTDAKQWHQQHPEAR